MIFKNCFELYPKEKVNQELCTWIHFADLLNERVTEASNDSATYWNHKIFVQTLHKSIYSASSRSLKRQTQNQDKKAIQPLYYKHIYISAS